MHALWWLGFHYLNQPNLRPVDNNKFHRRYHNRHFQGFQLYQWGSLYQSSRPPCFRHRTYPCHPLLGFLSNCKRPPSGLQISYNQNHKNLMLNSMATRLALLNKGPLRYQYRRISGGSKHH